MTRRQDRRINPVSILEHGHPRLRDAKTTRDSSACSFRGAVWGGGLWISGIPLAYVCSLHAPTRTQFHVGALSTMQEGMGIFRVKQQYN